MLATNAGPNQDKNCRGFRSERNSAGRDDETGSEGGEAGTIINPRVHRLRKNSVWYQGTGLVVPQMLEKNGALVPGEISLSAHLDLFRSLYIGCRFQYSLHFLFLLTMVNKPALSDPAAVV